MEKSSVDRHLDTRHDMRNFHLVITTSLSMLFSLFQPLASHLQDDFHREHGCEHVICVTQHLRRNMNVSYHDCDDEEKQT